MAFVHLHWYSTFSFLEAIGKPKDIVQKAKEYGQSAIALTDLNVMYGAIQLYQAANAEGIKPIIGVEIWFVLDINTQNNARSIGSIVLLAKSSEGYQNLLKLTSFAGQDGIEKSPKIDLKTLEVNKSDLIAISWGVNSRIASMLHNGEPQDRIIEILNLIKNTLGNENTYLEILAQDHKTNPEIEKINTAILEIAEKTETPCIISNIYAYPKAQDKKTQELAMAIKDNLKLYDENHRVPTTLNHIMTEEEIFHIAQKNGYPQEQVNYRCENTVKIADSCNIKIEMGQSLFPKYEAEVEILNLYQKYWETLIEKTE